jgi:hypothetical protein
MAFMLPFHRNAKTLQLHLHAYFFVHLNYNEAEVLVKNSKSFDKSWSKLFFVVELVGVISETGGAVFQDVPD